jgi:hypothetical protein
VPALDVAAEPAPSTGSSAIGDVAQAGNVASHAPANAAPVVNATEPVLTATAAAVNHPTSNASHPADTGDVASHAPANAAPDTTPGQAPGQADTLLALATASSAPIEVPGSATAAPTPVAAGDSKTAAPVDPTSIAGDVIALKDAPPPPTNALFNGSQYTDYGIKLSSDIAVPTQHAASPADAASAHDTSVPAAADVQKHAPPPPDLVDTTHPIDHLGHAML